MTERQRTITDDVVEAMQRGVDLEIIREMGLTHQRLTWAESGNFGERDYEAAVNIANDLKIDPLPEEHSAFGVCYREIRRRLTGHENEQIDSEPDGAKSTAAPHVRYDVISGPSPEYQAGRLNGRMGIYAVVKLVDDLPPELVKIFDGLNSSQSRQDAYAHASKLNYEIASPLMRQMTDELNNRFRKGP